MSDSLQPMDFSPPVSSVHGILQARIQEWVAIPFSRGSSQPRDQTWVSHIAGRFFAIWATREDPAGKNLPAMQETWVWSLEDPLEKGMATHSSIAWGIPWTERPGRLQSLGCKELDTTERLTLFYILIITTRVVITTYTPKNYLIHFICIHNILPSSWKQLIFSVLLYYYCLFFSKMPNKRNYAVYNILILGSLI